MGKRTKVNTVLIFRGQSATAFVNDLLLWVKNFKEK